MISDETSVVSYAGNNSSSTPYAIPFRFDDDAWLDVAVIDSEGSLTTLAEGSGYTVAGDGATGTGTLLTVAPVVATSTLRIRRDTPISQTVDYENATAFPSATHEDQMDRLAMQTQDLSRQASDQLARSVRVPDGETFAELDAAASRKGRVFFFNETTGQYEGVTPTQLFVLAGGEAPEGIGIPAGGTAGQVFRKASSTDFDGTWYDSGILQGSGAPADSYGYDGQGYVDLDSGVLYEKAAGTWSQAFSPTPNGNPVYFVTSLPADEFGDNGDLAVIYSGGIISGLAEKSGGSWAQVASNAVTQPRASDLDIVELVDHFLGGGDVVSGSGRVGELQWEMSSPVGTGAAKNVGWGSGYSAAMGVLRLYTSATTGDAAAIQFSNGTDSAGNFVVGRITTASNFVLRWQFQASVSGNFYLGFSNNPTTAAAPTRFIGLKALAADTNFMFEATNGTPVTVDSTVAIDDAWHTFELTHDADNNTWLMSLDGATPLAVGITGPISPTVADGLSVTIAAWVSTTDSVIESLYLDTFQFYAELA